MECSRMDREELQHSYFLSQLLEANSTVLVNSQLFIRVRVENHFFTPLSINHTSETFQQQQQMSCELQWVVLLTSTTTGVRPSIQTVTLVAATRLDACSAVLAWIALTGRWCCNTSETVSKAGRPYAEWTENMDQFESNTQCITYFILLNAMGAINITHWHHLISPHRRKEIAVDRLVKQLVVTECMLQVHTLIITTA